ncbi:MAG: hypothetical protein LC754_03125 [Acidobacteria bacterium]|nr:hypothetical protein [Acidobacteriota bacterium]
MANDRQQSQEQLPQEEPPPFGGSWTTLYVLVLFNLALLVALFYLFTRTFA